MVETGGDAHFSGCAGFGAEKSAGQGSAHARAMEAGEEAGGKGSRRGVDKIVHALVVQRW